MFERILVPLDGSSLAEGILPYAHLLGTALGARVSGLRVIERHSQEESANRHLGRHMDQAENFLRTQAVHYFADIAKRFPGVELEPLVGAGKPEEIIVDEASKVDSTLIAMSTHGRTGIGRWLLGSVTDKVLHTATSPLLVVRAKNADSPTVEQAQIKSIIVPLDGSKLAEAVFPIVTDLAAATSSEVLLIRAVSVPAGYYAGEEYEPPPDIDFLGILETEATEYLEQACKTLRQGGLGSVKTAVLVGYPASEVEAVAERTPDSIIAISSHGRSGIGRTVLGSVADRLVRHSGSPVLVIRPTE